MNTKFWTMFEGMNKKLTPAEFARACEALALVLGVPNPGKRNEAFESLVEEKSGLPFYAAVREAHRRLSEAE